MKDNWHHSLPTISLHLHLPSYPRAQHEYDCCKFISLTIPLSPLSPFLSTNTSNRTRIWLRNLLFHYSSPSLPLFLFSSIKGIWLQIHLSYYSPSSLPLFPSTHTSNRTGIWLRLLSNYSSSPQPPCQSSSTPPKQPSTRRTPNKRHAAATQKAEPTSKTSRRPSQQFTCRDTRCNIHSPVHTFTCSVCQPGGQSVSQRERHFGR